MYARPDLSVVIPAYNEEKRLPGMLLETIAYFERAGTNVELIVVDDGSRDRTSQVVLDLSREHAMLHLIRVPRNRGKGHAVRTGVVNARGRRILFADADGATPIGEVERLRAALDGGAEVAIGSRAVAAAGVRVKARFYRRVIGRTFNLLVGTLAVRGFSDTQCGFKLFTAGAAHELFARSRMDGFSFDVELLVLAQRLGRRVAEVPVNWEHKPGSQVNLVTDSLRMALDMFVIRSNALRGRYERLPTPPLYSSTPASAAVTAASVIEQ